MIGTIDLSKTVYELCRDFPETIEIMKEAGFESITNPAVLRTAGRLMTIPKGAEMKNINLDEIKKLFISKGYSVSG